MRYQIINNVWGEWVIVDLEADDYITWPSGEVAKFLNEEQAREFLKSI